MACELKLASRYLLINNGEDSRRAVKLIFWVRRRGPSVNFIQINPERLRARAEQFKWKFPNFNIHIKSHRPVYFSKGILGLLPSDKFVKANSKS